MLANIYPARFSSLSGPVGNQPKIFLSVIPAAVIAPQIVVLSKIVFFYGIGANSFAPSSSQSKYGVNYRMTADNGRDE